MFLPELLLAITLANATAADGVKEYPISSRELSPGNYELTVTVRDPADVSSAQAELVKKAQRVCRGKAFAFGHYAFDASEQTGNPPSNPRLTLRQEVECGSKSPPPRPHSSYEWVPSEADTRLVGARTEEYLAQKDKGDVPLAYSQFSDSMKAAARFDSWSEKVAAFNVKAGPVQFRKIQKVSWVKDPPGVDPGFYAAVDYVGQFQNVLHECGYVAWYRESSGRLSIVREEEGFIDNKSLATMKPEELQVMLARIRCVGG